MKLSGKTMLVLAGVITASVGLNFAILQTQVFPSFDALEQSAADQNLNRVQDAIQNELHHLNLFVWDWASWDDSYEFAEDRSEGYIESNLTDSAFTSNGINLISYYNLKGGVIWGKSFDPEGEEVVDLESFGLASIPAEHPLLQHDSPESSINGVYVTEKGPMLIASRPIITSDGEGPIRGTLIMGRLLTEDLLEGIREQVHVDFKLWTIGRDDIPEQDNQALGRISSETPIWARSEGDSLLLAYGTVDSVSGDATLLIRADTPKQITAIGHETINYALLLMLAVGAIVMLAMWLLLKMIVIGPLGHLTGRVLSIAHDKDKSRRLSMDRADEIGTLAQEFDRMMDELLHTEGMAMLGQITATVSHELRNPLGAMRNSIFAVTEKTRNKGLDVESALERVDRNIQRCDGIITDLLNFAQAREPNRAALAFDSWLEKAVAAHTLPAGITISSDLAAAGAEVRVDAEQLGCAIDNLIENACQAMTDSRPGDGSAEIKVTSKIAGDRLEITIADQGPGIPADVLPQIFEPLFSTKGFGVGVGLPTVKRILDRHGGGVSITSDAGAGTVALLWLPLHGAQRAAA